MKPESIRLQITQVDAFADRPFAGNPAAVCVLPQPMSDAWMQAVALEMNLSETAFLLPEGTGYRLRWFTPKVEVDLCGHATLASAHVLWETGQAEASAPLLFETRSGRLTARQDEGWITLDFPAKTETTTEPPPGLLEALNITLRDGVYVGKNAFDYLVEVESEAMVRSLTPDFTLLASIPVRGIIVTSRASSPKYDFVSRFFAPAAGVDEDPVTGSAHCCLGPYWQKRLGRDTFIAYQASPRGGVVRLQMEGDRVLLGGQAITMLRGELTASALSMEVEAGVETDRREA